MFLVEHTSLVVFSSVLTNLMPHFSLTCTYPTSTCPHVKSSTRSMLDLSKALLQQFSFYHHLNPFGLPCLRHCYNNLVFILCIDVYSSSMCITHVHNHFMPPILLLLCTYTFFSFVTHPCTYAFFFFVDYCILVCASPNVHLSYVFLCNLMIMYVHYLLHICFYVHMFDLVFPRVCISVPQCLLHVCLYSHTLSNDTWHVFV